MTLLLCMLLFRIANSNKSRGMPRSAVLGERLSGLFLAAILVGNYHQAEASLAKVHDGRPTKPLGLAHQLVLWQYNEMCSECF